jgi:2-polyprenyl-6-methoxyphenol hydroxylase-like FAD-dependent oxidoreductase
MPEKVVVVGAGPVGSLAALYAAGRGYDVDVYELRPGRLATSAIACVMNTEYIRSSRPHNFVIECHKIN